MKKTTNKTMTIKQYNIKQLTKKSQYYIDAKYSSKIVDNTLTIDDIIDIHTYVYKLVSDCINDNYDDIYDKVLQRLVY